MEERRTVNGKSKCVRDLLVGVLVRGWFGSSGWPTSVWNGTYGRPLCHLYTPETRHHGHGRVGPFNTLLPHTPLLSGSDPNINSTMWISKVLSFVFSSTTYSTTEVVPSPVSRASRVIQERGGNLFGLALLRVDRGLGNYFTSRDLRKSHWVMTRRPHRPWWRIVPVKMLYGRTVGHTMRVNPRRHRTVFDPWVSKSLTCVLLKDRS